jgi:hypothetical protein
VIEKWRVEYNTKRSHSAPLGSKSIFTAHGCDIKLSHFAWVNSPARAEVQIVIEKWRVEYNTKRPHSAPLGSKSIFTAHGCDIKLSHFSWTNSPARSFYVFHWN